MPGLENLLKGILKYKKHVRPAVLEQFQKIRDRPEPKAVMYSCMDSRIIITRLLQSNAGDMLLVRNAGNLVPHSKNFSYESATTEPGALELGCIINNIRHVMVCGHSDCKAMNLLYSLRNDMNTRRPDSPLSTWLLRNGTGTVAKWKEFEASGFTAPVTFEERPGRFFKAHIDPDDQYSPPDKFSQINTLQQLQNIASYSIISKPLDNDEIHLHALWFDVYTGDFVMYCKSQQRFIEVNDDNYMNLMRDALGEKFDLAHLV